MTVILLVPLAPPESIHRAGRADLYWSNNILRARPRPPPRKLCWNRLPLRDGWYESLWMRRGMIESV